MISFNRRYKRLVLHKDCAVIEYYDVDDTIEFAEMARWSNIRKVIDIVRKFVE